MENLIGPLWDTIKLIWAPVDRRIQYAKRLGEKIEKLDTEARYLSNRRKDIESELSRDVDKVPNEICKGWIDDVEKIEQRRRGIKDEYAQNKKCLSGLFPDMKWRMSLGKRIEEVDVRIGELKEMSKFEGGFVLDAPPPAEFLQLPMTVEPAPINRTLQKVLVHIRNEKIHRIGIWGMGGVGKTTVVKALNNLPEISITFEIVIWVTVSSQGSVEKIQKDVAKRLSINVNDADPIHTVANKIYQILSSKKFLLLLDDVWSSLDLGDIGIPNLNEQGKGSKVVLTTRDQTVCNDMDIDEIVKVDRLSKEEAWNLFAHKAGDVVNNRSINPYAKDAIEECDGLPLAIIVLGAALRNTDDVHVWCSKLRELQSSTSSSIRNMEDRVFKPLRFSYDQLGDDNIKQCFLYCALYPEDEEIEVDGLIEYWRAEGLTGDAKSIIDGYNKGRDILNTLVQKSLLEMVGYSHCRMHDLLRDLALIITSPRGNNDNKFLVRAGLRGGSYGNEEEWKQMKRISFKESTLVTLPESPDCPILSTLFLQCNLQFQTIPNKFFQHLAELQVLDLSHTSIRSLPSCISCLVNLQGLYLNYCHALAELPSEVGSLKKLEELQMSEVALRSLPFEIMNLNRLISFIFSSAAHFRTTVDIPAGVITSLISLEQLKISVMLLQSAHVAMLDEVASLRNLTKIDLHFPEVEHLERFVSSSWSWKEQRFLNFHFVVNENWGPFRKSQLELSHGALAYICRDSPTTPIPPTIMRVLSRSQEFMVSFRGNKTLSEFGMQNINGLKVCEVWSCYKIEILANADESEEGDIFPDLEYLELGVLPKLRAITEGQLSVRSFSNLNSLRLKTCHHIKHIFSWNMIKQLSKLESLFICVCDRLEDIFEENEIEPEMIRSDGHQLPRLKILKLFSLPKLVSIDKIISLASVSIEEIWIDSCNVKSLPSSLADAPKLRKIASRSRKWWDEELEWEDNIIKQRLQLFFVIGMYSDFWF